MLSAVSLSAPAQNMWPVKPIKFIVVFPPGGSVDQVARILAAHLQQTLGQPVVVENRAGASGSIGTQYVSTAPADGYTYGFVFDTHAVNPSLIPNMAFDTVKDLRPVTLIGTSPMVIVAHPDQPYKNFREAIAAAKTKPIAIGSIGTGSLGHLAIAQISELTKAEFTHIPYRGGGPLVTDALGGQVPLAIGSIFVMNPHVKAGKLRALAVTSEKPSPQMPGVGTVAEQGVPGYSALAWWGVVAPANTSSQFTFRMYDAIKAALKDPAVAEKLTAQGMDVIGGSPVELDTFVRAEIARWAKVVSDNKIKAGD
jgi:tripartite-type tricarboxylate transporter receptor subunit TctC